MNKPYVYLSMMDEARERMTKALLRGDVRKIAEAISDCRKYENLASVAADHWRNKAD